MSGKQKTEGVRRIWDKYKFVALVALAGAVLLLWPGGDGKTAERASPQAAALVEAELQQEMEDILGRIQGVGEVQVLLTVESDGERQLAQDSELSYSGSTAAPEDYSRSSQTVLVDDGSAEAPVVTRTVYPTYRGALVVCQGGDRADVKLAVTEAVAAHHRGKIAVMIWRRRQPMSARWKRNTVVATMVLLVCAAVALNWKYTGEQAADAVEETGTKILGEATLVSGQEDGGEAGTDEEAVYTGGDYFASARLTRQQARDNAISLLQEAADQSGADAAVANEASEGIQVLAGYTMKEAQIENLVTAKGYTDCVAFMGEDSISVVVDTGTGELTAEDVAKITDIAMTETGYPASGIKIMASN